jgi:ribosomal protein S3AE
MANTNQRRLAADVKRWANGSHQIEIGKKEVVTIEEKDGAKVEVSKMVVTRTQVKSPKAKGVTQPGHGRRTNVGDPRKQS